MIHVIDDIALNLSSGSKVLFQGEQYAIKLPLSLESVLIKKISDRSKQHAKISELSSIHENGAQLSACPLSLAEAS
jgi:hypothetical protein